MWKWLKRLVSPPFKPEWPTDADVAKNADPKLAYPKATFHGIPGPPIPLDELLGNCRKAEEAYHALPKAPPPEPDPLLVAACKKTPDALGCVEVERAGSKMPPVASFTAQATLLTPAEIDEYCRKTPLFRRTLDPDPSLLFVDRAAYLAVLHAIPDMERAELYAAGGLDLIRATAMLAVEKIKAAQAPKPAEPKTYEKMGGITPTED